MLWFVYNQISPLVTARCPQEEEAEDLAVIGWSKREIATYWQNTGDFSE
jgi:hypothetical protein